MHHERCRRHRGDALAGLLTHLADRTGCSALFCGMIPQNVCCCWWWWTFVRARCAAKISMRTSSTMAEILLPAATRGAALALSQARKQTELRAELN